MHRIGPAGAAVEGIARPIAGMVDANRPAIAIELESLADRSPQPAILLGSQPDRAGGIGRVLDPFDMLALAVLLILGPDVLFGLTVAILLGTFIGTYSSIYISSPALVWMGLKPDSFIKAEDEEDKTVAKPA